MKKTSKEEMDSVDKLREMLVMHMEKFGVVSGLSFCLAVLKTATEAKKMIEKDGKEIDTND